MYPLDNGTVGYTWRKEWVLPFESTWGIIERFKYFNAVQALKYNMLGIDFSRKLNHSSSKLHIHCSNVKFDEEEFAAYFGIDLKTHFHDIEKFMRGTLSNYMSRRVKICPCCIKQGYHSYFHQLYWSDYCYIHKNERLIRTRVLYESNTSPCIVYEEHEDFAGLVYPSLDLLDALNRNKIKKSMFISPYANDNILHLDIINLYDRDRDIVPCNKPIADCISNIICNPDTKQYRVIKYISKNQSELATTNCENGLQWHRRLYSVWNSFFSDYCIKYSLSLSEHYDSIIMDQTLSDIRNAFIASVMANIYFEYDPFAISILYTAAAITNSSHLYYIEHDILSTKWSSRLHKCLFEELFVDYIYSCQTEEQFYAFKTLYKFAIDAYFNEILKVARTGRFSKLTKLNIIVPVTLPVYIVVEREESILLIEVRD